MRSILRLPLPAIVFGLAALVFLALGPLFSAEAGGPSRPGQDDGFTELVDRQDDGFTLDGWRHQGPGGFTIDSETGVLRAHGGMGLLWYAEREFSDFVLELEFKTSGPDANSGVFLRVPDEPTSSDYIYHSFEVQIHDTASDPVHRTGAIYDAEAATEPASRPSGEWNTMRIEFVADRITVQVNGVEVVDWAAEPRGKVEDFADSGYIGLQNHDDETSVWFRDIRVKDLSQG